MKEWICTVIGVAGSFIASLFGGWDAALATLVIFMAIDYITGLIVAGVFHNSGKTENGALESVQVGRGCAVRVFPFWWFWLPAAWI